MAVADEQGLAGVGDTKVEFVEPEMVNAAPCARETDHGASNSSFAKVMIAFQPLPGARTAAHQRASSGLWLPINISVLAMEDCAFSARQWPGA